MPAEHEQGSSEWFRPIRDAAGKVGEPLNVNVVTQDWQYQPSVVGLAGGGFVVSWTDEAYTVESGTGVRARVYSDAGAPQTGELHVSTATNVDQLQSSVGALADGGFVVAWKDESPLANDMATAAKAQIFDALGNKVGGEILVSTEIALGAKFPAVAGMSGGGFVVTWTDSSQFYPDSSLKAQLFSAGGNKIGAEIIVSPQIADEYGLSEVVALPWGGFAVSWTDRAGAGGDTSGSAIRMQIFDATGGRVGESFQVNETALRDQAAPTLGVGADGTIAIGWTTYSGDGGGPASAGVGGRVLTLPEQITGTAHADFLVAGYGDSVLGGTGRDLLSIDFAGATGGVSADFRLQTGAAASLLATR